MTLYYREFGAGTPLIILHGLFGSGTNWQTVARQLSERYHVYTPDQRNHGRSPQLAAMDYPGMATDLSAFIAAHALATVHLVGHSMGGKVAMVYALEHPERVRSLTVVDIAPVRYAPSFESLIHALQAIPLAQIKSRSEADAALAVSVEDAALRQFLLQNLVVRDGVYHWRINLDAIAANVELLLGFPDFPPETVYVGPTLFIAGARSNYIRDGDWHAILGRFPDATLRTIPDAGHWPHAEQPERFIETLRGFLARQ
jgi:pimeloyl-ACP methyl ester carboxylesterase